MYNSLLDAELHESFAQMIISCVKLFIYKICHQIGIRLEPCNKGNACLKDSLRDRLKTINSN
jgi:hypothetical protein